jgi:hypothetical protein
LMGRPDLLFVYDADEIEKVIIWKFFKNFVISLIKKIFSLEMKSRSLYKRLI